MSRILRLLSNKEIRIKEYRPANAVFNTNEYSPLEECCILDETIDPFEMFYKNQQLQNNWNELKKFVEAKVKHWEEEEKKWIELGFMKFGGEANNKLIFKIVLDKMQELEGNNEWNKT